MKTKPETTAESDEGAMTILVPTDFSALAQVAVDAVLSRVKDYPGARVTLLHVVENWQVTGMPDLELPVLESLSTRMRHAEGEMERLRSGYDTDTQARIDAHVLTGNPAHVICDVAHREGFRVIVLSSHGHAGLVRMLIGSVAERVVHCLLAWQVESRPYERRARSPSRAALFSKLQQESFMRRHSPRASAPRWR